MRLAYGLLFLTFAWAAVTVDQLQVEYLDSPLGIDTIHPRFSWQIVSDTRSQIQTSYRIQIGDKGVADGSVWDSTQVNSPSSFNVRYSGPALRSAATYWWHVQVWVNGTDTTTSSTARFSMGLLATSDWAGEFIGLPTPAFSECPWFRKSFQISSPVQSALLYVASVGYHEAFINGHPISEAVLSPSVSLLPKRVLYRAYDVSSFVQSGENAIGLWLGPGWAMFSAYNSSGSFPQVPLVMAELRINTSAGVIRVSSGSDWKTSVSNVKHAGRWQSSDYGGDLIDDRLYVENWTGADFDDSKWAQPGVYALDVLLSADIMEPTVRHSTVSPKAITSFANGSHLVEMSEVFQGWFEVHNLVGEENSNVTFRVSTTEGTPVEYNMIDHYIFNASKKGHFRMRFSYHEIQYIFIDGLASPPQTSDVIGYRLTSNFTRTGQFSCSNTLITTMYNITVNNYQGITSEGKSVDCPHRERLGYGGDGHTSYQFALAHFGVAAFFTKWARDWADIQESNGHIANTAPTLIGGGGPAWGGYAVTLPWQMYVNYGDTDLLQVMYPTMVRLLGFFAQQTHPVDGLLHNWTTQMFDFLGDWLTPHGSEGTPGSPECLLFNNCYLHYITQLTANISRVLGNESAAQFYDNAAINLAQAINKMWFNSSTGVYLDMLQTHIAMPLATGVVPASSFQTVVDNLEHSIVVLQKGHLDTGLTGTYFMTKVLTDLQRNDLVFTFLTQLTFPGYGYFVSQGFTTWPEEWSADRGVSKMHGCYNAIGLWFTQGVVGIRVDFSDVNAMLHFRAGVDIGDISWARGSRAFPYGIVESSWAVSTSFEQNITVPVNARARISIPAASVQDVQEGGKPVLSVPGISYIGMVQEGDLKLVVLQTLSGAFQFSSPWNKES